jgi:hypothetical protein
MGHWWVTSEEIHKRFKTRGAGYLEVTETDSMMIKVRRRGPCIE